MIIDARFFIVADNVIGRSKNFVDYTVIEISVGQFKTLSHLYTQSITELNPFGYITFIEEVVITKRILIIVGCFQCFYSRFYLSVYLLIHRCSVYRLLIQVVSRSTYSFRLCLESFSKWSGTISIEHKPLFIVQQDFSDRSYVSITFWLSLQWNNIVYQIIQSQSKASVAISIG